MSDLKKQSYKAFAWDFTGKIAGQSVGFIISIFLARILSPEDFGLLAMVTVVIGLSGSLVDMGLGTALIQRKEVTDAHYGSVFFFNITVGLLLTGLLFFAAPLVGLFYKNDELIAIAQAMSVLFILNSIGNVIRIKLRKDLEYGIPTRAGLVAAVISGAVGVTMAFQGFGVWSLVGQSLLNPVISNVYLFYVVKWRPKLIFQLNALRDLWGFGFRMFLSGMLDSIFTNADSLIIGKLFPPATLGHYFRARSLNYYVINYSSGSIMSVLFPAFSKVQHDRERFKEMIFNGYHLINLLAFFFTGLFFVIGTDLIILLFGEKWQASIPLFQLIIIVAFGYPLSSLLVNIISASGNSKAFLKLEIIKKVFFGLSLAIGFIWGIEGYLICNAIAYVLAVYTNIIFASFEIQVKQGWFLRISLPYFLLTLFLAGGLAILQSNLNLPYLPHLFISGSIFTLIFVLSAWILNIEGFIILKKEMKIPGPIKQFFNFKKIPIKHNDTSN